MKRNQLAATILFLTISSGVVADVDVGDYSKKAAEDERAELTASNSLCSFLTADACEMLEFVLAPIDEPASLDGSDRKLLAQVMNIGKDDVRQAEGGVGNVRRRQTVRNAAMTLGHALGMARESTRYNRLWADQADIFDQAVRFDVLMMESDFGPNLLPAVISQSAEYSTTIESGRTFRAAGRIYRIDSYPRFVNQAPTWRNYLFLTFDKPTLPPQALMPSTKEESELFRIALVRGYKSGMETAQQRASAAYERLLNDFTGMVLYHLLLSYDMVTLPIVDSDFSAVSINAEGNEMSLDDMILRIKILPRLDGNRNNWKALPILDEFEQSETRRHIRRRIEFQGGQY